MKEQFINNRITVSFTVSSDMVFRYSTDEMMGIMKKEVAQELGQHALKKCIRTIRDNPSTLEKEFTHHCYIFSEKKVDDLVNHIKMLESENQYLRFEQNRNLSRQADWRL